MKARVCAVIAIVLALAAPPAAAEWFPKGEVFEPLIADPNETRTFLSMLSVDSETVQSWFGDVGVGVNFGLYRWAGKQPGDASQLGPLCRRELALRPGRIVLSPRQHRLPGRFHVRIAAREVLRHARGSFTRARTLATN